MVPEKPAMPVSVNRDEKGKWKESKEYRLSPEDPCPGAADFDNPFHDLVFREFEVLRAFPGYAASLDRKPSRLVDALVVVEWERRIVSNWLEKESEAKRRV